MKEKTKNSKGKVLVATLSDSESDLSDEYEDECGQFMAFTAITNKVIVESASDSEDSSDDEGPKKLNLHEAYDKVVLGYVDSSGPSSSTASGSKTVFVSQSKKGDKGMKSITDLSNFKSLLDLTLGSLVILKLLMFVTNVVFLDTFILITLSCILKSKCSNCHRFPLKELHLCLESY